MHKVWFNGCPRHFAEEVERKLPLPDVVCRVRGLRVLVLTVVA